MCSRLGLCIPCGGPKSKKAAGAFASRPSFGGYSDVSETELIWGTRQSLPSTRCWFHADLGALGQKLGFILDGHQARIFFIDLLLLCLRGAVAFTEPSPARDTPNSGHDKSVYGSHGPE